MERRREMIEKVGTKDGIKEKNKKRMSERRKEGGR